jgi:WD40 repeat protein
MIRMPRVRLAALSAFLLSAGAVPAQEGGGPIPVKIPQRDTPVDFRSEVYPILKAQCLACHHAKEPEGGLILESPAHMLKGGDNGPAVVAGQGAKSLIVQVSALQAKPHMPPKKNKVDAKRLTPEQLGLLHLWIDQGAKDSAVGAALPAPVWRAVVPTWNPVYAVALDEEGLLAACGRAGRLHVYHLPTGKLVAQPVDPALSTLAPAGTPGLADRDSVYAVEFSPDGARLATGGYRSLRMWKREDAASSAQVALPDGVKAAALSADGHRLAAAGPDAIVRLFDLAAGKGPIELKGHAEAPAALRFSPDGTRLLSGSADRTIRVWNAADGTPLGRIETPAPVAATAWAGSRFASAGPDGILRLWAEPDAKSLDEQAPAPAPDKEIKVGGAVTALVAVAGGLLVGGADGKIGLWNPEKGAKEREAAAGATIDLLEASPDGRRWLSVSGNAAMLWDAASGKKLADLHTDGEARRADRDAQQALGFATGEVKHAERVVKGAEDERKKEEEEVKKAVEALPAAEKALKEKEAAWAKAKADLEKTLQEISDQEKGLADAKAKAEAAAKAAAEGPKGADLKALEAAAESASKGLREAEEAAKANADAKGVEEAKLKSEEAAKALAKGKSDLEEARKALDKAKVDADKAAAAAESPLKEAPKRKENAEKAESGARAAVEGAKLNLDSAQARIEKAKQSVDRYARAIEEAKGLLAARTQAQKDAEAKLKQAAEAAGGAKLPVSAASFLGDAGLLAIGDERGRLHLFAAESGMPAGIHPAHEKGVLAAGVRSGRRLSIAGDGSVREAAAFPGWSLSWSVEATEPEKAPVDRVLALAFSADGKTLATGGGVPSRDGELVLWDAETGKPRKTISPSHSDSIYDLEFSPDGTLLASAGADRFARVFDVAAGKLLKSFEGHTHHVLGVSWNRTGRTLASCAADESVKVWSLETGQQVRTIKGFAKQATALRYPGWDDSFIVASGGVPVRLVNEGGNVQKNYDAAGAFMYDVAVGGRGQLVAAGGLDGMLRVWTVADAKILGAYPPPAPAK